MKNDQNPSKKGKGAAVGLVICFVAAIAMVGTYTFKHYKTGVEEQLALAEEENKSKEKEQSTSTNADQIVNEEDSFQYAEARTDEAEDTSGIAEEQSTSDTSQTAGNSTEVYFSEESQLLWPVSGNIVMNYSMDQTVYFSTLDQYKYNPALMIAGEVNAEVLSAANGIVKSVDVIAQTGTTVTVDIGNGYEAVYGQLKEVPVEAGTYVEAGTVIGYLSEPTKYYSVEGCNLYFELLKDGEPVNPMEYLEA